jgi:hypothetical protein
MTLAAGIDTNVDRHRVHGPGVHVDLPARYMGPDGVERATRIVEASTGELSFCDASRPACGDRLIVHVDELGRFEGTVERETPAGFAVALSLTESRSRKLAAQLVWFANRDACGLRDARRHPRIVPRMQWTRVRLSDGREHAARILDVSLASVGVETAAVAAPGDRVAFGVKTAVVLRVFAGGFVAEFDEPLLESQLTVQIRL